MRTYVRDAALKMDINLPEIENSQEMKTAIKYAVYTMMTLDDPVYDVHLKAQRILDECKENVLPSVAFIEHPMNRVASYLSDAEWLTEYIIYVGQKIRNMDSIVSELSTGLVRTLRIIDADDPGVCSCCGKFKYRRLSLSDILYEDLPPFHMQCRCNFLLLR